MKFTYILFIFIHYFFLIEFPASCYAKSDNEKTKELIRVERSFNEYFKLSSDERINLERKANTGDAEAAFKLSNYFLHVKHNKRETLKWLEKAAKLDHLTAQNNLGCFLSDDKEKLNKAYFWFHRAAKLGSSIAQHRLAEMHETGQYVAQDYQEAFFWYRQASLQGYTSSIKKLIEYFTEGRKGIKIDLKKGYIWSMMYAIKVHYQSISGHQNDIRRKKLVSKLSLVELREANDEFIKLSWDISSNIEQLRLNNTSKQH